MDNLSLFPPQQEVLEYCFLDSGFHCLLNMATGSGKTYLAELAIDKCLQRKFKAIYLSPLKALADEKYADWQARFPRAKIGIFTGDTIYTQAASTSKYLAAEILIMTPERFDACMRNWRNHWGWIPDIDLLVVDEFHLLGDPHRGPRLEGSITRLLRLNPFARILCLSATLFNVNELSDWLQGVCYTSKWRQIPLKQEVVRFAHLRDKLPRLIDKLQGCISNGGKSIVFVNSRARAKEIDAALRDAGFISKHHHAGLDRETRQESERSFRNGDTQVLVCTSTIEMGLNLPARQVIIYDCYNFDGNKFGPLPVWSYIQRAGRAGRPGLDKKGEVVLFAPRWMKNVDKYALGNCEPIISNLNSPRHLAEQILIELTSGYSRNIEDLGNNFLPLTLANRQNNNIQLNKVVNRLILADMLKVLEDDQGNYLKATRIGRLAVRLMFSPGTIVLIKDVLNKLNELYLFDLLLLACLSPDCSPVLPANYEDIEHIEDIISVLPSKLMDLHLNKLESLSEEMPSSLRLLSGIKMGLICHLLINGHNSDDIAEKFNIYPNDVRMLQENVVRILQGMSAILKALNPVDEEESKPAGGVQLDVLCAKLSDMLKYEINFEGVKLTAIPGVGGKLAQSLINNGLTTIHDVTQCNLTDLTTIPGIGVKIGQKIIDGAQELSTVDELEYQESPPEINAYKYKVKTSICPYRLRRSLELIVRIITPDLYLVNGGREDHQITNVNQEFQCDCADHIQLKNNCKHILAVKRILKDQDVCNAITKFKETRTYPLRTSISSLWFSISHINLEGVR